MVIIIITFIFIRGLMVFRSTRKHLLISLFSLEYIVIVLFILFFIYLIYFGFELYYSLIFLVFSVCEGALGLGVLVNLIRRHGNDLLSSLSVLSW